VTRLLNKQDKVMGKAGIATTPEELRPAVKGQTSVLGRPFAPSMTPDIQENAPAGSTLGAKRFAQEGIGAASGGTIGAVSGATSEESDGMTPAQRAMLYGAAGAGFGMAAPSVLRAVRKEAPSQAGDAWTAKQLSLGQRGVPEELRSS
jgi:hypothetical protein